MKCAQVQRLLPGYLDGALPDRRGSRGHARIAQHLDITIRHLALVERLEAVDQGLLELASFVGESTAGGNVDVSGLCRYAPLKV